MFDVFGEFDSAKEINMAAEGLKNEGDKDSLYKLAKENGIESGFVDMYLSGAMPELCDVATAAIGKIDIEAEEMKPKEIILDWVEYIKMQCMESEMMAVAVRRKGKSIKGCIAELLKWSFKNQIPVDKDVLKAAGVNASRVTLGIPGMGTAKKIIMDYYMRK